MEQNIFNKKLIYFFKLLCLISAAFTGIFAWHDGLVIFFEEQWTMRNANQSSYLIFWLICLTYLFIGLKNKSRQSQILVFFIALSITVEFYGAISSNNYSNVCLMEIPSPRYYFIQYFTSSMSCLGVILILTAIFHPHFRMELDYLVKLDFKKDNNKTNIILALEIFTSFPFVMGIYHIFFLIFGLINTGGCYSMSFDSMMIMTLPWIILQVFYAVYCISIFQKKRYKKKRDIKKM